MSKLQEETYQQIKAKYPHFRIKENHRPEWLLSDNLTRLELDLYIDEIKTGIEVQGIQHYEYVPHFHKTYEKFLEQKHRDEQKRDLCNGRGIRLVEISCSMDLQSFLYDLEISMAERNEEKIPLLPLFKKSKMRNKEFARRHKIELRNLYEKKKKIKYYNTHPISGYKIKKLGNKDQRRYAKYVLFVENIDNMTWKIYGGRDEHIIRWLEDNQYHCDCYCNATLGNICTHICKINQKDWDFPSS